MRCNIICCLLLTSVCHLFAQDTTFIQWDPVQQMSFDSTFATVPEIVAIGDTVHLKWEISNAAPIVYYRRSTDGGTSWSNVINLDSTASTAIHPQLTAANHAAYLFWFRCEPCTGATQYNTYVRNSLNAGLIWNPERFVVTFFNNGVASKNALAMFANGRPLEVDSLMHSVDYGFTWNGRPKEIRPYDHFALLTSGVHLVQEVLLNELETVYSRSSDFGLTWSPAQLLSTNDGHSSDMPFIAGDGAGNLYAAWRDGKYGSIGNFGASIIIRRSTNGGLSWLPEQLLSTRPDGYLPRIALERNNIAISWVEDVGYDAIFTYSSNFGQSWTTPIALGSQVNNSSVALSNGKIHLVWSQQTGSNTGQVYYLRGRLITTGVEESNSTPDHYALQQNYPNPFNSSTAVAYQIPRRTQVRIILYDILGRELRRIVNTEQQPGKYTLQIELPDLPSGVYFYRMQAGAFIATRKLLLMR
jgi:hypothetical protein